MRSDKAVKTAYLGLQLFYMAEVCMISGFAVLFLSSRGMNNSAAGATVALARLLSILILNPLSRELDTDKVLLKKLFPIAAALLFLLHVLLVFVSSSIFYTFLVFAAASMVSALCSSLSTILYSDLFFGGIEIDYGLSRGLGSFSYTVVSYYTGRLVAAHSPECIPFIGIAVSLGFLLFTMFLCSNLNNAQAKESNFGKSDEKLLSYIRGRKGFSLLFVGILLIYSAYISANSFAINLIRSIGGSANELGIYNSLGALFEIPFMIIFSKVSMKNSRGLLCFSLLLMTLKVLLLAASHNMFWVCGAAILQGASFGLYTPSIVNYIKDNTSYGNSAKGQSVVSIAASLGGVSGMLISGKLLDNLPVRTVLLIMVVISLIGSATVWQASLKITGEP